MTDGRCLNSDAYCCLRCKRAERAEAERDKWHQAFSKVNQGIENLSLVRDEALEGDDES